MRKYIEPSVKLLDKTNPDVWYKLWLSSRSEIVRDESGNKVDLDKIPETFYVGGEKVDNFNYMRRIHDMGLQYMNFPYCIFEINGSCLFRDLLFNINNIAEWATSNRFLFSILDKSAVYDESNYAISSEYKDIPEWEDQFDKYMDAIKKDDIVDHNRIEMPYSISSKFWIGIQYKDLLELLRFLKFKMPFFYEVYGYKFLDLLKMKDSDLVESEVPTLISQYLLPKDYNECGECKKFGDTYSVDMKMGLVLYSQFLRQSYTRIAGLYNVLLHSNSNEFIHKVFKGGTIINIHYVAHENKVKQTVSNRLCAFAMSSGNDYNSWSYFIRTILGDSLTTEKLKELLPCKFEGNKLVECKFHEDIKFRNEGKERSNCPCPLVTLSMEDAKRKRVRDDNFIGDAFYELTKELNPLKFDKVIWTSRLQIYSDGEIDAVRVTEMADMLEDYYKSGSIEKLLPDSLVNVLKNPYGKGPDYTACMKGFFMDILRNSGVLKAKSYLINFGGDIFAYNYEPTKIRLNNSKFYLNLKGTFSVFTSGNTAKRGDHIVGGPSGSTITTIVNWNQREPNNKCLDAYTTLKFANSNLQYYVWSELPYITCIPMTESGIFCGSTYCASPFFDKSQIEIRDKMASNFSPISLFRPDLTISSKNFDAGDDNAAELVVEDNLMGIEASDFLVYPSKTTDLGTLFELGRAINTGKYIIKYNEDRDEYTIHKFSEVWYGPDKSYLVDCSIKSGAIKMGMLSAAVPKDNMNYELKGSNDNLMLSVNYSHVELNKSINKYERIYRDKSDRDK